MVAMPDGLREGILERRRGPGIIGKWEPKRFRLEGCTLTCFPAEEGGIGGSVEAEGITSLRQVSNLALEYDKCECTFLQTDGNKIRLRAKTADEAQSWFLSLQAGQAWVDPEEILTPARGEAPLLFDRVWPGDEEARDEQSPPERTPNRASLRLDVALDRPAAASQRARSADGARRQASPRSPRLDTAGRTVPQTPPGRVLQLHALHGLRQRRLEDQRLQREAKETQRLAAEREAMKQGTRGNLNPATLNPHEAAQRLYKGHAEAEQRLMSLRLQLEEEEQKKLQETRFRRGQARAPADANAGVRLYEDHKRREQEKKAKRAEQLEDAQALEKSMTRTTSASGANHHEKLYQDAHNRREQLDKRLKEKEAAEAKRMAEETATSQRTRPVDMSRIVTLHSDHETKMKKQALRLQEKQEKERKEMEEAIQAHPRRPPTAPSQEPIWQRGRAAYFLRKDSDTKNSTDTVAKRSSPELATQVDVAIAAVAHAVQYRVGDQSSSSIADLKGLGTPLRAILHLYKEALSNCKEGEGFDALKVRSSQRLFRDCCLLPDFEGFEQCREPNPIHQVEEDFDDLMKTAERAQVALQEMFVPPHQAADWQPGETRTGISCAKQAMFAYSPGVKMRSAAEMKARVLFQPAEGTRRFRHLLDLARLTLVFPTCDLLQAGLDEIIGMFEVVRVSNHFGCPTRIGERYVEVLLVITLKSDDGLVNAHVCELRLEELSFFQAREKAAEHMEEYDKMVRALFHRPNRDMDAIAYLARATLQSPPETHEIRSFRRHLNQTYGSPVVAWRRMGGSRVITFDRFRDVCNSLKCRDQAPRLWCTLEPGSGGCISLFELAPDAVSLLARLRAFIMGLETTEDSDDQALFDRLAFSSHVTETNGRIEAHEFSNIFKPWGFSADDAARIFRHLDYQAGTVLKPSSSVTVADIGWLRRLGNLVDLDAVLLRSSTVLNEFQSLGELTRTGSRSRSRMNIAGAGVRRTPNAPLQAGTDARGARDSHASSSSDGPGRRSRSLEPCARTGSSAGAGDNAGTEQGSRQCARPRTSRASTGAGAALASRSFLPSSSTRGASPRGSLCTTVSPSAATSLSVTSSPLISPTAFGRLGEGLAAAVDGPFADGGGLAADPAIGAAPEVPGAFQDLAAESPEAPPADVVQGPPDAEADNFTFEEDDYNDEESPEAVPADVALPQGSPAADADDYNAEADDYNVEEDDYNAGHDEPVAQGAVAGEALAVSGPIDSVAAVLAEGTSPPEELPQAEAAVEDYTAEADDYNAEPDNYNVDADDYNAEGDDYNAGVSDTVPPRGGTVEDCIEECF